MAWIGFLAGLCSVEADLPLWREPGYRGDWLVEGVDAPCGVYRTERPGEIVLANGLVARTFLIRPNAATVSLRRLDSGDEFVRAVEPEAIVTIDGRSWKVGGLVGQPNRAFLYEDWLDLLRADPESFQLVRWEALSKVAERLPWVRRRHSAEVPWPPNGATLTLWFAPPQDGPKGLEVGVRYEVYQGLPALSKQVLLRAGSGCRVDQVVVESLAAVESESAVDSPPSWSSNKITVLTDYSFVACDNVHWLTDPEYTTQVNYLLQTPCLLRVYPKHGPGVRLAEGESFESFRSFLILHDDWDRERQGLAVRRFHRALAPWVTENPLMLHLTSTDEKVARTAIDQAADCGFEMVNFSFGSGLNMEDDSPANIAKFRALANYAHSKGLEIGGYSLLASRSIDAENDCINPETGKPGGAVFGNSPCLGSRWGLEYFRKLKRFLEGTGFDLLEHDGSYPGDVCASTSHPGHEGLADSQWRQYRLIADFYRWCRSRGIFLNVPDSYMLAGSNKTGMGYRETNWSLPRRGQHVHARQNLFDGTWLKTPSMGWMFTPLVEYQGGGAAATIEPLREHLRDYESHLANNLGFGAQSCYRGPRLYDAPETREMVRRWVAWFKKNRRILDADVIHLRRADGRRLDFVLHADPQGKERGLLMVFNPTDRLLEETIRVPMRYTGLRGACRVSLDDGKSSRGTIRDGVLELKVRVPANGRTWAVFLP